MEQGACVHHAARSMPCLPRSVRRPTCIALCSHCSAPRRMRKHANAHGTRGSLAENHVGWDWLLRPIEAAGLGCQLRRYRVACCKSPVVCCTWRLVWYAVAAAGHRDEAAAAQHGAARARARRSAACARGSAAAGQPAAAFGTRQGKREQHSRHTPTVGLSALCSVQRAGYSSVGSV